MTARWTIRYSSGAHSSKSWRSRQRACRMRNMIVRWYPELGAVVVVPVPP